MLKIKSLILFFAIFAVNPFIHSNKQNKIIYLISPPRSLSVAFLRMIAARGDFTILHEPSQWAFDSIHYHDLTKDWFRQDAPATFEDVKKKIFTHALTSNVFVKEMSFAVRDFLLQDNELIQDNRVYFILLLRDPHHTVISFYKKTLGVFKGFSDVIGYKDAYELFEKIKHQAVHAPLIILSEDLYNSPKETIQKFCDHVGIEFKDSSLK